MSKIIVHIDLNAFFVRCEEIRNPSLVNKPVAIGHEGRCGIVSTCSYTARKFGVRSGQPMFEAKNKCPDLIIIPDDFAYYRSLSVQFVRFVKSYTPLVEQVSVDEVFADFTSVLANNNDPIEFFTSFQKELFKKTKLYCSIGVATTKFLAKMGSDYKKPQGLTIIRNKDIPNILFPLDIENMFMVGKKTTPRLREVGIKTIGDLKLRLDTDDKIVKNILGKFFYVAKDWLNAKGDDNISLDTYIAKSIGRSVTFSLDTDEINQILDMINQIVNDISNKAKKDRQLAQTVQVVIKTPEFRSFNKSISLDEPTNNAKKINTAAKKLFIDNFKNMRIRLVGVTLQNLVPIKDVKVQMSLFNYETYEEEDKTKLLINKINRRLNKEILMRASEVKK